MIVTNCIVCDGNPERENRNILLSKDLLKVGVAFGPHVTYGYCTIILSCTEFKNVDNSNDLGFFCKTSAIKKNLKNQLKKTKIQKFQLQLYIVLLKRKKDLYAKKEILF